MKANHKVQHWIYCATTPYEPGSKLLVLGMVIQPLIGNPYNGYINPYYWVDDHPLLYGNNGSLDPSTYKDSEKSDGSSCDPSHLVPSPTSPPSARGPLLWRIFPGPIFFRSLMGSLSVPWPLCWKVYLQVNTHGKRSNKICNTLIKS